ncbi:hypothetical protein ACB040_13460 [Aeromonas sp. S11(2024)]|uniref:hypothetical protein n=1 Tax=unclassified Aeromonas TaxID=257493 RepID=UPI003527484A
MGVDKVGYRAAMPGAEYFLCCMMAPAGDIKGQSAIARRKYTDKKLQYLVCEGEKNWPASRKVFLPDMTGW